MGAASGKTVGGSPPPPDPGPLTVNAAWQGAFPYNGAGASGVTSGFGQWFAFNTTGGIEPVDFSRAVIENPSGKLDLAEAGGNLAVTWSGLAVNESQYIIVKWTAVDASTATASQSATCVIKRTS